MMVQQGPVVRWKWSMLSVEGVLLLVFLFIP